eukprot:TRINITY_DN25776_c0_g1_i1.p1 TRINITY_DN25776_c0_g1~~TRINITY_DN25776_c0_g1_i1.p1  ORF type:complete len:462 (+),score=159.21 TRINITY_DN25776_c0_g1_i1:79-1464(+)
MGDPAAAGQPAEADPAAISAEDEELWVAPPVPGRAPQRQSSPAAQDLPPAKRPRGRPPGPAAQMRRVVRAGGGAAAAPQLAASKAAPAGAAAAALRGARSASAAAAKRGASSGGPAAQAAVTARPAGAPTPAQPGAAQARDAPPENADNIAKWFGFIVERQRVFAQWLRRSPQPWTECEAIMHGRLCNVFRFLDRQSVYLVDRVIIPLANDPADLIFNIIVFRAFINRADNFDALGAPLRLQGFSPKDFEAKLGAIEGSLSNAAYNVGSFGSFSHIAQGPGSKNARFCALLAELCPKLPALAAELQQQPSSERTFRLISRINGIGPFIAYQICVDIGYWSPRLYDEAAHVYVGPGAEKGLEHLFNKSCKLTPAQQVQRLVDLQDEHTAGSNYDEVFRDVPPELRRLNLMSVENCLCEGHKYFRFQAGGRFKQKYSGQGATPEYREALARVLPFIAERRRGI